MMSRDVIVCPWCRSRISDDDAKDYEIGAWSMGCPRCGREMEVMAMRLGVMVYQARRPKPVGA